MRAYRAPMSSDGSPSACRKSKSHPSVGLQDVLEEQPPVAARVGAAPAAATRARRRAISSSDDQQVEPCAP